MSALSTPLGQVAGWSPWGPAGSVSPSVLPLLAENPFPGTPPRFVHAMAAPWCFAPAEERAGGRWWRVGPEEPFLPARESR